MHNTSSPDHTMFQSEVALSYNLLSCSCLRIGKSFIFSNPKKFYLFSRSYVLSRGGIAFLCKYAIPFTYNMNRFNNIDIFQVQNWIESRKISMEPFWQAKRYCVCTSCPYTTRNYLCPLNKTLCPIELKGPHLSIKRNIEIPSSGSHFELRNYRSR